MAPMLRVEFHCHTSASKDCLVTPARIVECAIEKGIDRLVITDHNTTAGAVAASALDARRIIVGEEIMTTKGELLAAFVRREVPEGLAPMDAISQLRDQGAFISVSHPFDVHRNGAWLEHDLLEVLPFVDAIEIFNSRVLDVRHNARAREFAGRHNLVGTVGSDAHTCWELGRSTQRLPDFETADGLRTAMVNAAYATAWSPPWVHLASRYAVWSRRVRRILDAPRSA